MKKKFTLLLFAPISLVALAACSDDSASSASVSPPSLISDSASADPKLSSSATASDPNAPNPRSTYSTNYQPVSSRDPKVIFQEVADHGDEVKKVSHDAVKTKIVDPYFMGSDQAYPMVSLIAAGAVVDPNALPNQNNKFTAKITDQDGQTVLGTIVGEAEDSGIKIISFSMTDQGRDFLNDHRNITDYWATN